MKTRSLTLVSAILSVICVQPALSAGLSKFTVVPLGVRDLGWAKPGGLGDMVKPMETYKLPTILVPPPPPPPVRIPVRTLPPCDPDSQWNRCFNY